MHVKTNEIMWLNEKFKLLFAQLDGSNYVLAHNIIFFTFDDDLSFSLGNLTSIMKALNPRSNLVSGNLAKISWKIVQQEIHECLFCPWGPIQAPNTVKLFWELVSQHFVLPPIVCYQYEPVPGSCFDFGVQWNFCFILLNEQKQGIILHAGAID